MLLMLLSHMTNKVIILVNVAAILSALIALPTLMGDMAT
jgi:hypothetical protein